MLAAAKIPPAGCVVRTIREGVEHVHQAGEPLQEQPMPRGVYERKPRNPNAPAKPRGRPPVKANGAGNGLPHLLAQMRSEKTKAEDRVVALGTAIEALEALEA